MTEKVPVILATAHMMKGDREKFLKETLADDYVVKPVTAPQDLIDKINHLLELGRQEYLE